jgi:hypothetical protein
VINFDEISSFNNKEKYFLQKTTRTNIILNIGVIIGTNEYMQFIMNHYFNKYINNNSTCEMNFTSDDFFNSFIIIACNDNEDFNIKEFPPLIFYIKSENITFEFTYKDLFKPVYNNKYYLFLLFIKRQSGWKKVSGLPAWYLGRIFMNKYQFVFDGDNKKVGYYKMPIPEGKETPKKTDEIITDDINIEGGKNKPVDIIFIIFFGVILTIIIVAVIIVLYECLKNKKRKKRANELIDEDDYSNEANNPNDEDKAKN